MTLIKRDTRNRIPFDPWTMERFMNEAFGQMIKAEPAAKPANFNPPVEVSEDEAGYTVRVELPGVKREDIELTYEDGVFSLSGKKESTKTVSDDEEKAESNYHYSERSYGEFHRSFRLSKPVDDEKTTATYTDGVLEMKLPLAETAKPRKIDVAAN